MISYIYASLGRYYFGRVAIATSWVHYILYGHGHSYTGFINNIIKQTITSGTKGILLNSFYTKFDLYRGEVYLLNLDQIQPIISTLYSQITHAWDLITYSKSTCCKCLAIL